MNPLDSVVYFPVAMAPQNTSNMTLVIQQKQQQGQRIVAVVPHIAAENGIGVTKGMWVFFDR